MPLDPHLAGVLQMMAATGRKPTSEGTPAEGRAGYLALTLGTRKPHEVVPVASVQDGTVDGATGPLRARIYRPEGAGPFPTVAYFHGGGWVIGDLDTHDNMCRDLCRGARAVVVAVDYRLAPEHPFPAAVDDTAAATRWVVAHAAELGGNPTVGVAGDSAGGNLSAVVAQQLRDAGTALAAQFLIYPAVDHAQADYASLAQNAKGYFLETTTMAWFYGHYAGTIADPLDPRLAPLRHTDLTRLPPAVVVTAEFDPLRDSGAAYAEALRAAGNQVDYLAGPGMVHGFYDMGRWSPAAQALVQQGIRRFGEVLRGG
ncbi:alpha/beta hydrolase [Pseudorhodoferax sp. Leaf265]|uniref:alpha/beta hydrolase n=1 Tax=Pseudorhodoferax sp. Leaf265 TaxID=1736315 RepID=UPI0006F7F470|nr:alpha/beta hydrolase [Pseudorhodoferax sp. Leaf265]KQP05161.1 alpha/beta hydrolase [Pseudorhodoferax sp. Leaf265]